MATAARSPREGIAKKRSRHGYALDLRVASSLYSGAVNQQARNRPRKGKLSAGVSPYPSENDGDCASQFRRIRSSVLSLRLFNANYFAGTVAATEESAFRILPYRLLLLQRRPSLRTNRCGFLAKIFSPSGPAA